MYLSHLVDYSNASTRLQQKWKCNSLSAWGKYKMSGNISCWNMITGCWKYVRSCPEAPTFPNEKPIAIIPTGHSRDIISTYYSWWVIGSIHCASGLLGVWKHCCESNITSFNQWIHAWMHVQAQQNECSHDIDIRAQSWQCKWLLTWNYWVSVCAKAGSNGE